MKLRILDDSIRLRLTQTEVAAVGGGATVEAWTHFPAGERLGYALGVGPVPAATATYEDGRVLVRLPARDARQWADSDQVGIEHQLPVAGTEHTLRVLIEKDFRCLAPREDEDQSDAFAHPDAARGHES